MQVKIKYVPKIFDFFENNPYAEILVIAGGRGKGATWGIANELITTALEEEHFILCTREIKGTVDHSSRRTIERLIRLAGLEKYFIFQNTQTICRPTGTKFIYTGLSKVTEDNVQGMEGITRVWLGEAHTMEMTTWQKFEPTIRENKAKIYIDYNTQYSHTPIHALFTENPNSYPFEGKKSMNELAYLFMDYRDNIYCPEKTLKVAERNKTQYSQADWEWIWYGKLRDSSDKYICSENEVLQAMHREDVPEDMSEPLIVGCDIAHLGGDEIVFAPRRGYRFGVPRIMHTKDFNTICNELEAFINYDKAVVLVIDNGHIGAAVADEMQTRGYYVERINFGGTKEMHYDPEHCKDCATDMAFNFKNMLPKLYIPYDEVLKNQVTQRRWDFLNNKGIRKLESKDDFKKHAVHLEGHTSPDRGDAHWLACYNANSCVLPVPAGAMLGVY